jgi:hypothetical protein
MSLSYSEEKITVFLDRQEGKLSGRKILMKKITAFSHLLTGSKCLLNDKSNKPIERRK